MAATKIPKPTTNKNVGEFSAKRKAMEPAWRMLRTLRSGTPAMREARDEFLPMDFAERSNPQRYEERLRRSFLFEGYDNAVKRIAGTPFQKAIQVSELEGQLSLLEDNSDLQGTSLTVFGSRLMEDEADRGMAIVLVDRTSMPETVTEPDGTERRATLADEDQAGVRPYFARIAPDNFLDGQTEVIDGGEVVTELRVRSVAWERQADYSEIQVETVMVYKPDAVEVWTKELQTTSASQAERQRVSKAQNAGHVLVDTKDPKWPNGRIPVVVIYADDKVGPFEAEPPMEGLAWLNVQHWQSSSAQNWKLHYERCNILKAKGLDREKVDELNSGGMKLGAGAICASTSADFDLAWVEATGTALEGGRKDLEAIESRMERMGMEPLVTTSGPRTATGEMSADVKQQAPAQKWAEALEWGLFQAYKFAAAWMGETLPEDFKLAIWRDFAISRRAAQDLTTLDAARTRKDVSHETYLREIQKRGVIGDDVDIEEEMQRTDDEAESLAEMMPPPGQLPQVDEDGEPVPPQGPPGKMPPNMQGQPTPGVAA